MKRRLLLSLTLALAAIGASACNNPVTPTPTPTPTPASPPSSAGFYVVSVTPSIGFTAGGTAIALSGAGFAEGTTVTLGGSPVIITYRDNNQIQGTIPPHDAASVDIVVTNRGGQRATLPNYFTYVGTILPPRINRVSLGSGSTEGGEPLVVSGHDFFPGSTLTIGGVLTRGTVGSELEGWSGSFISVTTLAHAVGRMDIVVTNPDGQSDSLPGGYEYVRPESLDFNGNWLVIGGGYGELEDLRFRIQDNLVVGVSCDQKEQTYSTRPSVERGAFTVGLSGGGSVSGRIVGPGVAIGTMNVAGCRHSGAWEAWKYDSEPTSLKTTLNLEGSRQQPYARSWRILSVRLRLRADAGGILPPEAIP